MDPLLIVIVVAMLATFAALGLGLLAMSGGGETDREFSTKLMWTRLSFQILTLVLLGVAAFLR